MTPSGSLNRWVALEGATVIDGSDAGARADSTVLLRHGRVEALGPRAELAVPADAERRDLTGRFVLPGLLDAHAHVESAHHRRKLLAWGVTAFRNPATTASPGDGPPADPPLTVVRAGAPLDCPPSPWPGSEEVTTPDEVRAAVNRQADAGVDLIKLYVRMTPDLVSAAVPAAHRRGLPVLGDLALTSWTEAARAGIDFLSHAMPRHPSLLPARRRDRYLRELAERRVDPLQRWYELVDLDGPEIQEMLRALGDNGVTVDPTLVGVEAALGGPASPATRAVWPRVQRLVMRLRDAGVALLVGTDTPRPGIAAGESLHRELALLAEAGIPAAEVLSMATAKNAQALGLSDTHGLLAPGRRADLVVLTADPLARLCHTRSIETVYLGGLVSPRP